MQPIQKNFFVDLALHGCRLDHFLSQHLDLSRNKIQKLFAQQAIKINNQLPKKLGQPLKQNDQIQITQYPTIQPQKPQIQIPILYEDEDLLILNKPINLITHKANPNDTQYSVVDYLKDQNIPLSSLGESYRHGIIHRLDKTTSGAMIIAKNNPTHQSLALSLKARLIKRYYLCIIDLPLKEQHLIINSKLKRHKHNRLKFITSNDNEAKEAKTAFVAIKQSNHAQLLGAQLYTGRTHQIRAHLASINRHILGDYFYGYRGEYKQRILLHAHLLFFIHPSTQEPMEVYAPIGKDMLSFMQHYLYKDTDELPSKIPLSRLFCSDF